MKIPIVNVVENMDGKTGAYDSDNAIGTIATFIPAGKVNKAINLKKTEILYQWKYTKANNTTE